VDTLSYKTISASKETVQKEWVLIDAENEILGRLSTQVAKILRGKHRAYFTPHADCGDYVIIINADKIRLTGKKLTDKQYFRHSGYPGGFRVSTPDELLRKKPEAVIEHAVKGMLPKGRLGRQIFGNLYVYIGEGHPHDAQKPRVINLKSIK